MHCLRTTLSLLLLLVTPSLAASSSAAISSSPKTTTLTNSTTKGMTATFYSTKDGCSSNKRPNYFVYSYNGNAITQDACHTFGNASENHVSCVYFEKGGRLGPMGCGSNSLQNGFTAQSVRMSRNYCYVWSEPGCPVSAGQQALLYTGSCHDGITVKSFRCNWMNETTSAQQAQLGDSPDDEGDPTAPAGTGR